MGIGDVYIGIWNIIVEFRERFWYKKKMII